MNVFVDAGGWLSVAVSTDQHHEAGSEYLRALLELGVRLVTTDFVLDEVIARLRYDYGHASAAEFLAFVRRARANGVLDVRPISVELWDRAEAIFLRYADAKLSFTDCTSFALLAEWPVDEVFGFDEHFSMMGHIIRPGWS